MKFLGAVTMLAAGPSDWPGDSGKVSKPVVKSCINLEANSTILYRGRSASAVKWPLLKRLRRLAE
jgi:hypothetical protein